MPIPTIRSNQFDIEDTPGGKSLSADISELQLEGFPTHINLVTNGGLKIFFEGVETTRDDDQDIAMVLYKPTASFAGASRLRIVIFND